MDFPNPASGKPSPFQIGGLFLIAPNDYLRIYGHSMRRAFADMGHESTWKGLERCAENKKPPSARLQNKIVSMLSDEALRGRGEALLEELVAADSTKPIPGPWESFLNGIVVVGENQEFSYLQSYLIEIERSEAKVLGKFYREDFAGAFADAHRSESLSPALWPELREVFSEARKRKELFAVRWSVGLELLLSIFVAIEVDSADTLGEVSLESLLPRGERNPTARFFEWLLRESNCCSIPALCDELASCGVEIEESTLERWKGGKHQPAVETVEEIAALFQDDSRKRQLVVLLANASRLLNFIAYVSNHLIEARHQVKSVLPKCSVFFPGLPFGYQDLQSWLWGRYPVWREIHRVRSTRS
ncbi:MAG: hypothetical protein HUJ28_12880 [Chromatiales bacterium]|nr:hypothetical protein [Chromatiales bacterium]